MLIMITESYNLELDKAIKQINSQKAKLVCIHLPDGLKPQAKEISNEIRTKTKAEVMIWLGSNFGACDLPAGLERIGVDLVISWGHLPFRKMEGW
jgi:diphthamide biosynthesis enzyme Dph1/Dph2-like protein